ncbi:MAG: Lrp/AsnC family transcriptional regulator [Candidatus Bathyarchaeota archaeon]|nr:Lrp/AsnC family transcriptional regulator [Candidatus Bathyarchaeota archaeon]
MINDTAMIDETSIKVLEEYLRDARQSFREVARQIGYSSGTVANRVKEMEDQGIIKKFTVQLDYEKLGFDLTAVTEIIVSDGMMMEVGQEIAKHAPAISVYNVTGDSDIMVVAKFRTRQDLSDFTKQLTKMPYVVRTKTHVVLNTLKEESTLLPEY